MRLHTPSPARRRPDACAAATRGRDESSVGLGACAANDNDGGVRGLTPADRHLAKILARMMRAQLIAEGVWRPAAPDETEAAASPQGE